MLRNENETLKFMFHKMKFKKLVFVQTVEEVQERSQVFDAPFNNSRTTSQGVYIAFRQQLYIASFALYTSHYELYTNSFFPMRITGFLFLLVGNSGISTPAWIHSSTIAGILGIENLSTEPTWSSVHQLHQNKKIAYHGIKEHEV